LPTSRRTRRQMKVNKVISIFAACLLFTACNETHTALLLDIFGTTAESKKAKFLTYPPGWYSIEKFGETPPNMSFSDHLGNSDAVFLSDYYQHPEIKLLLLVNGTGWCDYCQEQAWEYEELYDEFSTHGLEILYVLSETWEYNDYIFDDPPLSKYDLSFMESWKGELPYPVLADNLQLFEWWDGEFMDTRVMLIKTEKMTNWYSNKGWHYSNQYGALHWLIFNVLTPDPNSVFFE